MALNFFSGNEKMKLLIVESPSKAKTINQYLGKEYEVVSSYGHIRALPSENGSVIPEQDFFMRFEVIDRSQKHVDDIVRRYKKCSELLLATDPDREGEAISWHIMDELRRRKVLSETIPVRRVVFNEITKSAILEAVKHPRELNQHLVEAQQTRQALDYLVGFTLSPVLWRKLPGSRSAGRVQSVALRIVSEREEEIERFKSQEYWTIEGLFNTLDGAVLPAKLTIFQGEKLEKFTINNQEQAQRVLQALQGEKYWVKGIEAKESKRQPPPPFTTSTMLQEAARKLGFSAKKTAKLAQDLYEGASISGKTMGLITYMRTDSVYVSEQAIATSRELIAGRFGKPYVAELVRVFKNKTKNAQEAHEAIRPTDVNVTPEIAAANLSTDHYKLYHLIWRRMMASQMSHAIIDTVGVDIATGNGMFRATGSTVRFDGFLKLYPKSQQNEQNEEEHLPQVSVGQDLIARDITPVQHFTEPPPRYTEASLVKKLEELGIGRPSTYPAIIAVLQDRGYVVVESKRFQALPKGRIVNAFLTSFFMRYVEYDFTAHLEDSLDEIAEGKVEYKSILRQFWAPFKHQVEEVMVVKIPEILHSMQDKLSSYLFHGKDQRCPKCNVGNMQLKNGKFGPFLGCSNYPQCNHIEKIAGLEQAAVEHENAPGEESLPKVLGKDELGREYSIKRGPYGVYIEFLDGGVAKRVAVPAGKPLSTVDLDYALSLAKLPRVIGVSDEYGEVKAGLGRFGPYVMFKGAGSPKFTYVSIKNMDPSSITLSEAEAAIHSKKTSVPRATKPASKKSGPKKSRVKK
jgi:DNA topoisomerase-1